MSLAIGHDLCARIRGAFGCCVRRRIRSPAAVQRNRVRDRSRRCWCNLSVSGTNGHESPSVTILCAQAATAFAWCCTPIVAVAAPGLQSLAHKCIQLQASIVTLTEHLIGSGGTIERHKAIRMWTSKRRGRQL
jgi:hypothetical protein